MSLVHLSLWAIAVLGTATVLAMLLFGLRSLKERRLNLLALAVVAAPLILIVVLGAVLGDWVKGAVLTNLLMLAVAFAAVLITGLRGLFEG